MRRERRVRCVAPAMRVLLLLFLALLPAAGGQSSSRTFTGIVTDSECAKADHSAMRMGDTDAECVKACIDYHGASYVLFDGTDTFTLSDQAAGARFAGRKVTVTGTLDEKGRTITVHAIAPQQG